MIFPLMGSLADEHWGVAAVLYARRESETSFEARRLCDAAYLEFVGARNADLAERIDEALAADRGRPFALCAATATLRTMQRAGCMANIFASRVSRRTSFKGEARRSFGTALALA